MHNHHTITNNGQKVQQFWVTTDYNSSMRKLLFLGPEPCCTLLLDTVDSAQQSQLFAGTPAHDNGQCTTTPSVIAKVQRSYPQDKKIPQKMMLMYILYNI